MMDGAYEISGEFSSYVRPEYGKIDPFIQELTGICEEDVKEAPPLEAVLGSMLFWLKWRREREIRSLFRPLMRKD